MDPIERAVLIEAGYDPDDPNVVEALDLVRWELSMLSLRRNKSERSPGVTDDR